MTKPDKTDLYKKPYMKNFIFFALICFAISGCTTVPMADSKLDADAKKFNIPSDKSGIYVYRNETFGGAVKMDVALDGEQIGQTAPKTFLFKEVMPGKHVLTSSAENTDTLEIDAKPGALSYVWQEVKMGILYARTKLHLMPDEEGKTGVRETSLAITK